MTEVTLITDKPRFWSLPTVAFFTALLAAPLIVALIGAALTFAFVGLVLLFSVPLGAPTYFLAGAPMFWLTILRGKRSVVAFAAAGAMANLIAAPLVLPVLTMLTGSFDEALSATAFIHGFGLVFAPLYGLIFGLVFRWLVDPIALPVAPPPAPKLPELPTLTTELRHV